MTDYATRSNLEQDYLGLSRLSKPLMLLFAVTQRSFKVGVNINVPLVRPNCTQLSKAFINTLWLRLTHWLIKLKIFSTALLSSFLVAFINRILRFFSTLTTLAKKMISVNNFLANYQSNNQLLYKMCKNTKFDKLNQYKQKTGHNVNSYFIDYYIVNEIKKGFQ